MSNEENSVIVDRTHKPVLVVTISRPSRRNAVDRNTAEKLWKAFLDFDKDEEMSVAILTGAGGNFCAGADLKSMAASAHPSDSASSTNKLITDMNAIGPMGPTRLILSKPTIAVINGFAVAGGLELSIWCDLRVADETAVFGVYCRTKGVPLIDGGTVRLPKLIGQSAAMDLILTGRSVPASEAKHLNLVNYLVPSSKMTALNFAIELGKELAAMPQTCMRNDRMSVLESTSGGREELMKDLAREFEYGMKTINSKEFGVDVKKFVEKGKL